MSKPKRTPGPWEINDFQMGHVHEITTANGSKVIARVYTHKTPHNPERRDDVVPNQYGAGNLVAIAAASDMLDALENIQATIEIALSGNPLPPAVDTYLQAMKSITERAIKKATATIVYAENGNYCHDLTVEANQQH